MWKKLYWNSYHQISKSDVYVWKEKSTLTIETCWRIFNYFTAWFLWQFNFSELFICIFLNSSPPFTCHYLPYPWTPSWASRAANAGDIRDVRLIPRSRRSSGGGHGNPLQYSWLENPMDRGGWCTTVHGLTKSQTRLKWLNTNTQLVSNSFCAASPLHVPQELAMSSVKDEKRDRGEWFY